VKKSGPKISTTARNTLASRWPIHSTKQCGGFFQ
jgi:hypothetical protein